MDGYIEVHHVDVELTTVREVTANLSPVTEISGNIELPRSRTVAARYPDLMDKPILNNVVIDGNKVSEDYRLQGRMEEITPQDIDEIIFGGN